MVQLGQYAPPKHVIAHLSDTHFLDGGAPLHGSVDTVGHLRRALDRLIESEYTVDAIIHTGSTFPMPGGSAIGLSRSTC